MLYLKSAYPCASPDACAIIDYVEVRLSDDDDLSFSYHKKQRKMTAKTALESVLYLRRARHNN